MPRYLSTLTITPGGINGLVQNPQNRREVIEPLFQAVGGQLEHYWVGVGENSFYVVFTAPDDDINLEALTMIVYSSGIADSFKTSRILTSEEAMEAAKKASDLTYRSPSGNP